MRDRLLAVCAAVTFIVVAGIYAWNASHLPFGSGYDEPGHAAYIRYIVTRHAVPGPLSGWATFHPPLYYLIASGVWSLLEPLGPAAVITGVRAVSWVSMLASGLLAYWVMRELAFSRLVALLSTSLLLTMAAAVMAASWMGNEALTAATSSCACCAAVILARKHSDARWALAAGVLAGLAFASKYTGAVAAVGALAATYDLHARRLRLRNTVLVAAAAALVSVPVLLRNVGETGSPFPMTRDLGPIAEIEAITQVDRSIIDYVTFSPRVLTNPRIYDDPQQKWAPHMQGVWGLTYVGFWSDPFGHRLPVDQPTGLLDILPWLGLAPTLLMLLGLLDTLLEAYRGRLGQAWVPLLATALAGFLAYVHWTWRAATLVAVKGSYLLPLVVPAACFFARGFQKLTGRARWAVGVLCAAAIAANGVALTQGLLYDAPYRADLFLYTWMDIGSRMPQSGIHDTLVWWLRNE